MKILVLSDSHGTLRYMEQAIETEKPDYVIHLGDHCRDADNLRRAFPMLPVASVAGNCDYAVMEREQILSEWGGVRILAVHGHRQGVKQGLLRLAYAAREAEAAVALFGHTHQPYCEELEGLWLLNPGSCGGMRPTCGIVEIHGAKAVCTLKRID